MINISDNKWIIRFYFLFMVDDTRSTSRFVSHKICFETVINRFLIIFCISIFLLRRTFILDTRFTKWFLMQSSRKPKQAMPTAVAILGDVMLFQLIKSVRSLSWLRHINPKITIAAKRCHFWQLLTHRSHTLPEPATWWKLKISPCADVATSGDYYF